MNDFWLSCGHHLLDRDAGGGLVVTADFLKAYLARPELSPPPEACVVERTLHAALLAEPRRPVAADEVAAIADADARENWQLMLAFRHHLERHRTVEAAYLALVRHGVGRTPPLFLNQLVQVILRNALDDCADPMVLRAAELFFRPQLLTLHEGALIAADEETLAGANDAHISPLVSMMGLPASGEVEVMGTDNAAGYYARSDRFDMALDFTAGRPAHEALASVLACWVRHLLALEVEVEPLTAARNVNYTWYVGLDPEATRIGDALWSGDALDEATQARVVGLYRLTFRDPSLAPSLNGEPVYLILAMTADRRLRMKPQNLVVGLPVRHLEAVS
jgi:hypothetical protein